MTREEAIDSLKYLVQYDDYGSLHREAISMAIESLKSEPCEDAVSREAVLNILMPYCTDDDGSVENTDDLRNALDDIESLPSVTPTSAWIPVEERLPEESLNSVIGWDRYRERCVFVQFLDGHFHNTGKLESFDIVAWMPLPESYKPQESESAE